MPPKSKKKVNARPVASVPQIRKRIRSKESKLVEELLSENDIKLVRTFFSCINIHPSL
jgi:hypothetical protein